VRIVVHDYSGHPGQVHLSRELARRGHQVEHQFCSAYVTGRGATERRADDPATFTVRPVELSKDFARYSPVVRVRQELQYARAASRTIASARPDVVVLSNVPLLSLLLVTTVLRLKRLPYVFWHQDVYSNAIDVIARSRLGAAGAVVGWLAQRAERRVARGAEAVVPISDSFRSQLDAWGVDRAAVTVVPNWAALDEMPQRPKDNPWSRAQGLATSPVLLYAGTLGLKHDPALLADLAAGVPDGATVVVVSEGRGRTWLEGAKAERGLSDLRLLDYQPYDELPDVLASADVLIVVLESDASRYSVPSKVLNYLCAGRAVLAVLPEDNGVAQTLRQAGAGVVVAPGDAAAAVAEALRLLADPRECAERGHAGRAYAERTFDVVAVGEVFERVLRTAAG
jgi:colanic acid biosynthesis glycosyl transferase WcaI